MDQRKLMDNANTITDMAKVIKKTDNVFTSSLFSLRGKGEASWLYPFLSLKD